VTGTPTSKREIEVLLATFNGARFLRPQIESILDQSWPSVRIVARDDGSSDETSEILAEYRARFGLRFSVLPTAKPTGSAKLNFETLLQHSTDPWVAFADQDDIWLPNKLERCAAAMERLEQAFGPDRPLLVFSDLEVVDCQLAIQHPSFWKHEGLDPNTVNHLGRLLLQNVVTGCTMLINRPLAKLAAQMPSAALMHDSWTALLACLYGKAEFIPEPLVRYRQHSGNVVGASAPMSVERLLRAASNRGRNKQRIRNGRQAAALLQQAAQQTLPRLTDLQTSTILAFLRSGRSSNSVDRIRSLLQHGIVYPSPIRTAALLWSVWNGPARDDQP
jgi:glycosyltransferase involved in cell wall biosynthesis